MWQRQTFASATVLRCAAALAQILEVDQRIASVCPTTAAVLCCSKGPIDPTDAVEPPRTRAGRLKKFGLSRSHGRHEWWPGAPRPKPVQRTPNADRLLHLQPEQNFIQPLQRRSGGRCQHQRGVDRPDRGADHPVGLDAGLVQAPGRRRLVGAERAAALQDRTTWPGSGIGPLALRLRHPLRRCHVLPFQSDYRGH